MNGKSLRETNLVSPSSLTHSLSNVVHVDFGVRDPSGRRADVWRPRIREGRRAGHKWYHMWWAAVRGEEDSIESHHLVHGDDEVEVKRRC